MNTLFIACASLGVLVLVIQILFGFLGLVDAPDVNGFEGGESAIGEGFELLSVRSVAAGVGFFGLGGLAATTSGAPAILALLGGGVAGVGALVGTALLMRQVLRLDSDGSLRLEGAVGLAATVYLSIPPARTGPGKVHFALQGRTVEIGAITPLGETLDTGASVVVVSIVDPDTVEVIPVSLIDEVLE
jgi:hypothetical protein